MARGGYVADRKHVNSCPPPTIRLGNNPFLETQILHIPQNKVKRLLTKVIRRQTEAIRSKVDQLASLAPLRPIDELRRTATPRPACAVVGVKVVRKVQKVRQRRGGRIVVLDAVKRLEDVAAVQSPQDRGPLVVRRDIGPAGHVLRHLGGDVEDGAAGKREDEITQYGGDALVLGVNIVLVSRVVRGPGRWVVGI